MLNIYCTTLFPNFHFDKMQHSSCKLVFLIRVKNFVDPDQMASSMDTNQMASSEAWADLDLQCFQKRLNLGSTGQG